MVATIAPLNPGKAGYYVKSYYLNGRSEGLWLATEANRYFHLSGRTVTPTQFKQILSGYHPTSGKELVQNAGKPKRQIGWDIQFAIDKSFSILHAVLPETREAIESSVCDAALATIRDVLEPQFLESRRGPGGRIREQVSAPFAGFLHETNRADEKHIHYHSVLPNVGLRSDNTTGTIVSWNLYDANHALGKVFHAYFAEFVSERSGIECAFDEHGLSHVKDFPQEVCQAFSTPSRIISETAADGSAKAKEAANLKARHAKSHVPCELVDAACQRAASELGFTEDVARSFLHRSSRVAVTENTAERINSLLDDVLWNLPEQFSKAELYAQVFKEGAARQLPTRDIKDELEGLINDSERLECMGRINRQVKYRKIEEVVDFTFSDESTSVPRDERKELKDAFQAIASATPTLGPSEFIPKTSADLEPTKPEAALPTPAPRTQTARVARYIERAADDVLKPLGDALRNTAEAKKAVVEAAQRELARELEQTTGDPLFASAIDTASPGVSNAVESAKKIQAHREEWIQRAKDELKLTPADSAGLLSEIVGRARGAYTATLLEKGIARALESLTSKEAHFAGHELRLAVWQRLQARNIPVQAVIDAVGAALKDPERVVCLGKVDGVIRYSTPEMLRVEEQGFQAAEALSKRTTHIVGPERLKKVFGKFRKLTADQKKAVLTAATGPDLVLIEDREGTGLHLPQNALGAALRFKRRVIYVAPTASAAEELVCSAGAKRTATLKRLVEDLDKGYFKDALVHHGSMLVHTALFRGTSLYRGVWRFERNRLTPNTTVVLDSASMADTRLFSKLLVHAEKAGARVVVTGAHYMPSLSCGGFYKELLERAQPSQQVVLRGNPEKARLISSHSDENPMDRLIEEWRKTALKSPQKHIIVAPSSKDVRELNRRAQQCRKQGLRLGLRSITIRYEEGGETHKERVYEGDRIVFTGRMKKEIITGSFGTVTHIDLLTGRITVKLDREARRFLPWEFHRKKKITFSYRNYGRFFQRKVEGFRLGYAASIYRTQNIELDGNNYVLYGGPHGAPSAVYAKLGLARGRTHVFGHDLPADVLGQANSLKEKYAAHTIQRLAAIEEAWREHQAELGEKAEQSRRQRIPDQELGFSM